MSGKNNFGILALVGPTIICVVMVRDDNQVTLFFGDSQYQSKGIGES